VLKVLEAIERQLDDLPPLISTRYRMATGVLRLAVVAFGDNNLTIPAIVIARGLRGGRRGLRTYS